MTRARFDVHARSTHAATIDSMAGELTRFRLGLGVKGPVAWPGELRGGGASAPRRPADGQRAASETMVQSGYFVAFSDADGVLLWSDGSERALQTAVAPRFLTGFTCREDRIGTNAIGTALVVDWPVQIFSAEHFNQLLHGWTCAAAPVHDPDSGVLLGAIDLSGEFRTAHVHGLALVAVVAKAAEGLLAPVSAPVDRSRFSV
jgi:hypothetical protein